MEAIQLGNSKEDRIASVLKSLVGIVPYAGTVLSELVSNIIPNQRIDRVEKYIVILAHKISEIDQRIVQNEIKDEECIDLLEESFIQASRAINSERHQYIAMIVKNGISEDDISYLESKHIMKMIQELNDQELIWLRFYLVPTLGGDNEFRERNKVILEPISTIIGSDEREIEKAALQENYKEHLERLGLIRSNIRIDSKTKLPEFDQFTGKPKSSYHSITSLGRMVLKQIGLYDSSVEP